MNYKSFNLGDWIGHISGVIEDETTLDGNEMRDLVEFLSTLKQEPRKGHWVHGEYCSECGCDVPAYIIDWKWQKDMNAKYCPNCGADMREVEE